MSDKSSVQEPFLEYQSKALVCALQLYELKINVEEHTDLLAFICTGRFN